MKGTNEEGDAYLTSLAYRDFKIEVVEGKYNFVQLKKFKNKAAEILSSTDAVSVDIDEARNLLVIGIEAGTEEAAVKEKVVALDIPSDVVRLVESSLIIPEATLRSYIRPTVGGLQVRNAQLNYIGTLGFNVLKNSAYYFITSAHATRVEGQVDKDRFYQSSESYPSHYVGYEAIDPSFRSYVTGCPSGAVCRYSDAALIRYEDPRDAEVGEIARTYGPDAGLSSIVIDPDNPRFYLGLAVYNPIVGEELNKMGRSTGWTTGTVQRTCQTVEAGAPGKYYVCQALIDYASTAGDSGGPVFSIDYLGRAHLYGIHQGRRVTFYEDYGVFSTFEGLQNDLGRFTYR